jgi:hypothetical protein
MLSTRTRAKVSSLILVPLTALVAAACNGNGNTAPSSSNLTLTTVNITGTATIIGVNQTVQFSAVARFSNGTTQDVTGQASWQSSNTAVATVSPTGSVSVQALGSSDIRATYQGMTGTLSVSIVIGPFTGTWVGALGVNGQSSLPLTYQLVQTGNSVTGSMNVVSSSTTIQIGTANGNVSSNMWTYTMKFTEGDFTKLPPDFMCFITAQGTATVSGTTMSVTGTFTPPSVNQCPPGTDLSGFPANAPFMFMLTKQ